MNLDNQQTISQKLKNIPLFWSLTVGLGIALFWLIWSKFAPVPVIDKVLWIRGDRDSANQYINLAFAYSRWWDILIALIIALMGIRLKKIAKTICSIFSINNNNMKDFRAGLTSGLVCGLAFGLVFGLTYGLVCGFWTPLLFLLPIWLVGEAIVFGRQIKATCLRLWIKNIFADIRYVFCQRPISRILAFCDPNWRKLVQFQEILDQIQIVQQELPLLRNRDEVAGIIERLTVQVTAEMDRLNRMLFLLQDELLANQQARQTFGKIVGIMRRAQKLSPKNQKIVEIDLEIVAQMAELEASMQPDQTNGIPYDQEDLDEVLDTLSVLKIPKQTPSRQAV